MMNRSRQNLISGFLVQIETIVSGLILPKLILDNYGSVLNGLMSSCTQFISYLSLVEMGLYSASLVALYKPIAQKDEESQEGVFSAINLYYRRIALYFSIGTVAFTVIYPFFVKDDIPLVIICSMVLAVGAINLVTYLFLGKYKVFLQANNQIYIVNYSHIVSHIIYVAIAVWIITTKLNIVLTRVALIFSLFLEFFALKLYCEKKYNFIKRKALPLKNAIKQRKDIMVHQVYSLILNSTDVALLTAMGESLAIVSVYSMYNMVATVVRGLANSIMASETAVFGQMLAVNDVENLKKKVFKFEFYYNAAIFFIYDCMAILILPFIRIYTRKVTDINYDIPVLGPLFALTGLSCVLRLPYTEMINARGHYRQTKRQAVISASLNIILTIVLIPKFQIAGALMATIIAESYRSVALRYYCYVNILKYDWKSTLVRYFSNMGVSTALVIYAYRRFMCVYNPESLVVFLIISIAVAAVIAMALVIVNFGIKFLVDIYHQTSKKRSLS